MTVTENTAGFVKIICKKIDNFDLTLRKRLFCDAKEPLLPCKTIGFITRGKQDSYTITTLVKNIYNFMSFFSFIKRVIPIKLLHFHFYILPTSPCGFSSMRSSLHESRCNFSMVCNIAICGWQYRCTMFQKCAIMYF